jgi:hypothetical protein
VAPVHLAAFAGDRLHAHEGPRCWLGPDLADITRGEWSARRRKPIL